MILMSWESTLIETLSNQANEEGAVKMAAYMTGHFSFFGVPSPLRKEALRQTYQECCVPEIADAFSIAKRLYNEPQRNLHYCTIELLGKRKRLLQLEHISSLKPFILQNYWWDSVDYIAPNLIGTILIDDQSKQENLSKKWIESNELWLQ